jgi:hypothetical protein
MMRILFRLVVALLVLGGCLLEVKSTINTTRFNAWWLHQLLGYVLLDYSGGFGINSVGIYFARQARLVQWPLDEFMERLAGDDLPSLTQLRKQFRGVAEESGLDY